MKRAALHSLGCKVNAYETEAMQQLLEAAGYEIVPFREQAEVYIVNTCSVTAVADHKSRQMLHRAKKNNPKAAVVAVGCYAQAAGDELLKTTPVDLVIGNNRKKDLAVILEAFFEKRDKDERRLAPGCGCEKEVLSADKAGAASHIIDIARTSEYEPLSICRISGHTRAFIKVQDGCSQFCSYCIIPYTRGHVRSRPAKEVEAEVGALAAKGCQEVVLTGIHLSSYGMDLSGEAGTGLLDLVLRLNEVEGLRRIRLGSLEPRIVTEDFAKSLSGLKKICPHFHLSLQSGCDATLRRMNRHYTTAEYAGCCDLLRHYFDHPAITTDVIVGFPGEDEKEFSQTYEFLKQINFYEMHVFKYSRREGTPAARMGNQVPKAVKASRSNALLELGNEMSKSFRVDCLGRPLEVLLEEKAEVEGTEYMIGYTKEYVRAAVPYAPRLKNMVAKGSACGMLDDETLLISCPDRVQGKP